MLINAWKIAARVCVLLYLGGCVGKYKSGCVLFWSQEQKEETLREQRWKKLTKYVLKERAWRLRYYYLCFEQLSLKKMHRCTEYRLVNTIEKFAIL